LKRIKLLFHHDLPLGQPADSSNLLAMFAAPQPTYSKLWLSATDLSIPNQSLSGCGFSAQLVSALSDALFIEPAYLKDVLEAGAVLVRTKENSIRTMKSPENSLETTIEALKINEHVILRLPGRDGFDLLIAGKQNIHATVFNALVPFVQNDMDMLSINGKRVHRTEMLYQVDIPGAKLPHGFEPVASHFRM
jgi:hypothetical protein